MDTPKRNNTVDVLRIFAAYCIITLHNMSGSGFYWSEYTVAFCRFAVPLFFMISGYFSAGFDRPRLYKQVRRLLIFTVVSNVAYFLIGLLWAAPQGGVAAYCREKFTLDAARNFFLLNESPFASHLWFFSALLYALLLDALLFHRLMEKRWGRWVTVGVAWGLLIGGFLYYHLSLSVFGRTLNWWDYRNFLFMGTPLYLLGKLYRGSRLSALRLHPLVYLAAFVLLSVGTQREFRLVGIREVYLTSFLEAGVLLMLGHSWPMEAPGRVASFFAGLGRKYALSVFAVHIFFLDVTRSVFYRVVSRNPQVRWGWVIPPIVFVLSLLAAAVYARIKPRVQKLFQK